MFVEKNNIINGSKIQAGDRLIGLASNGIHSNGYSLVRKVFSLSEQKKMAGELLKPTRIYVKPVLGVIQRYDIKGIAHITGGAFYNKLTKIIPNGLCCMINRGSWPVPQIFRTIQKKGGISEKEMFTTFNMGVGMVLIVEPSATKSIIAKLAGFKLKSWVIGEVVRGKGQVRIV